MLPPALHRAPHRDNHETTGREKPATPVWLLEPHSEAPTLLLTLDFTPEPTRNLPQSHTDAGLSKRPFSPGSSCC